MRWKITKDKVLLGLPLGGAICFAVQGFGQLYDATGIAAPASLLAALAIGAAGGYGVEKVILSLLTLFHRRPKGSSTREQRSDDVRPQGCQK